MKLSKEQLEEVEKVAQNLEQHLEKPLTKTELSEIDRQVTDVLAGLGHYKRFFKRLT